MTATVASAASNILSETGVQRRLQSARLGDLSPKAEIERPAFLGTSPRLNRDWSRLAMVRSIYQQMLYLDPVVYDWVKIR
jgi:hypothetical protein